MGRSRGRVRARQARELSKAFSAGAARGFASANMSAQPRAVALGDAINALTGGPGRTNGLVIDDETRWMMRDPRDEVPFGPINPLRPDALDPVRPDTGRPEPRLTEYPVAWNLPGSADAPVPWATLRAAAENVDIMRRCISVRKEQLQGLDWSITLDDQVVTDQHAMAAGATGREDVEAELRRKLLPEIDRLTTFWRNPWKANGLSFEQWVNGVMEDHLVLDAVAVYPRLTYGGELSAFELIDPTTIKLLIDYRGARPEPPFPAFQQILYGFPRAEFGSCYVAGDDEDTVKPVEGMLADQLFYFREEYRSFTPYGYSAVQQALISARLYLRRQGWMLAEYDDGSTPLTFLVPDATDGTMVEKLTPKTRRQWEDSINAELAGQTRARNRMKVLMPGMVPHQMSGVDERYKPDYDMHLIKMLAGHFGVTSTGLGFSESKGLGNSGLHEGQERTQDAATTKPDKRMIERIVNELMRCYQGAPAELKFKFTETDVEDAVAKDAAANAQRERGVITLNDDRKALGKSPLPFREADMPMVKVGDGWVPFEGMADRAEQAAEAEQALVEDQLATGEATREQAAVDAEEVSGEDATKALELAAYTRWARKRGGAARRPFICKALEPSDWPGEQVPGDVDFAEWVWVPDGLVDDATDEMIEKAFGQGNDNWRSLARDSRGRWVKRGSMRVDALGPSTPDKPVLASLARDAERRRAAAAPKPAAPDNLAKPFKLDPLQRAEVRRMGQDPDQVEREQNAERLRLLAEHSAIDVTAGSSAADKLRRAELMYGSDRSKWPAKARQDAAKLERQLPVSDASSTMGGMTTPKTTQSQAALLRRMSKDGGAHVKLSEQGSDKARDLAALEAAGLAERFTPAGLGDQHAGTAFYRPTDAGRAVKASDRAERAERQAALDAGAAAVIGGGTAPAGSMAERITARQDQSVRDVVTSLQDAPGGWVAMVDVRRKLEREHGMDRGQQDAALRRLATTGDRALNTAPEDNQKTLTEADHAAAVDFGAGPQHVISLDPPRSEFIDLVDAEVPGGGGGELVEESRRNAAADAAARQQPQAFPRAPRNAKPKTEHRVTLPDGTVATRSSQHDYTHAVVTTRDNRAYARHLEAEAQRDAERGFVERAGWREQVAQLDAGPATTHSAPAFSASLADARTAARKHTTPYQTTRVVGVDPAPPSPARQAEAVAAQTPDAPSAEPTLSRKQRDMAARFDKLAGEHAADPAVARWRGRAVELTGQMERADRREADSIREQMATVQDEFTHAMAGARAGAEVRAAGGDERAQQIASTRATLDSRARKVTDRITQLEAAAKGFKTNADARKRVRDDIKTAKAERQRYLDRIESAERDHDTKLIYDADGRLVGTSHEPPAPKPAPSINEMMAANMAASTVAAPAHGAAHGKVTGDQIQQGTRVQFRGTSWHVDETPRRARPDAQGRTGVVFRATREDQGIQSTMRVNDGTSMALAAPKGEAAKPSSAADRVRAATSEAEARRALSGISRAELEATARELGTGLGSNDELIKQRIAAKFGGKAPEAPKLSADADTYARIADRLRSARTDEAARKSVNGLNREGLDGVARLLGIDPVGMKLGELRSAVVAARGNQ